MEARLLGPLEVLEAGRDVAPHRPQTRAVLLMLLLKRNRIVSAEELIDALWRDDPPETAGIALQGHVSALRKALGADRIETRPPGYRLRVDASEMDVDRFEKQLVAARTTADPSKRLTLLRDALELWRGEPLREFADLPFARWEIARFTQLYDTASEDRIQAELDLGHHEQLLAELDRMVRANPLRERLRAQFMLALYRSGRHADALHSYQDGRRSASEEFGMDPGPVLEKLQRQIVERDPALDLHVQARVSRQSRKTVTVLMAEVTPSSVVDPEDFEREIGPILDRSRPLVERYGGSVEPLFSNGVIGIFGAQQAHEDDPERAVRAALAVRDAVAADDLEVSIAIETRRSLVTDTGGHVDVTGDVLARASRLQAIGPRPGVTVSDAVHSATSLTIEYEPIGSGAWLARRVRDLVPPRHSDVLRVPFVAREQELAVLERAYHRAIRDESVQVVTIVGEAGSGKTRLLTEHHERGEASGRVTWREGRCLPYGEGVTLWALAEICKEEAQIEQSDPPGLAIDKLGQAIEGLVADPAERAWMQASLSSLVGVSSAHAIAPDQLSAAAYRFIEAMASRAPLTIAFEDLHWADRALLDFIEHLPEHVSGVPLLVLGSARPELLDDQAQWSGGKKNATVLTLQPLDEVETRQVMAAVLAGRPAPEALVRRAGGNPLFALELARIVVAGGATTDVPDSLSAVIAARLDTLAPEVRDVASDAAVVGETFWPGAVAAISGLDEAEILRRLRRLARNEFVRRTRASSIHRQEQFTFVHTLVRDVAYEMIPLRARASKHEAAGDWLAQLAVGGLTEHAELVAHHYITALGLLPVEGRTPERRRRAAGFLRLAGDRAVRFDVGAAERLYGESLRLLERSDPEHASALAALATSVQESGRPHESVPMYEEAIQALDGQGARLEAAHARLEFARCLWNVGNTARQRILIDEATEVLETGPASQDLARAWFFKGRDLLMQSGGARDSLRWLEHAIEAAKATGATDVAVRALQFRGLGRWELGEPNGTADIEEALRLGLQAGIGFETAICYSNLAEVIARRDGPARGIATYREGIAFAEKRGLVYAAMWMRGSEPLLLFEMGKWNEVLDAGRSVLDWDRARGTTQITMLILAAQLSVLVARDRILDAQAIAVELEPLARRIGDVQALMQSLPPLAELALARGDANRARELIAEAREASKDNPAWRSHRVADCVRVAIAAHDLDLAGGLLEGVDTQAVRARATVASAEASVAEATGAFESAARLYGGAVAMWLSFGHRVELAHALLGRARVGLRLGRAPEVGADAQAARAIFAELDAPRWIAEAEATDLKSV